MRTKDAIALRFSETIALIAFAALCVAGLIACSLCHVKAPDQVANLAVFSVGAAAGVAYPKSMNTA